MTEAARVPPTPPWRIEPDDDEVPGDFCVRMTRPNGKRTTILLPWRNNERECIAVRDALNGVSEGASPTLRDQVGGVPSPSAIDRLPTDAIAQVVRAYTDAYDDHPRADSAAEAMERASQAFRDALSSVLLGRLQGDQT